MPHSRSIIIKYSDHDPNTSQHSALIEKLNIPTYKARTHYLDFNIHPYLVYIAEEFRAAFSNRLCAELSATWYATCLRIDRRISQSEADASVTIHSLVSGQTYIKMGSAWI